MVVNDRLDSYEKIAFRILDAIAAYHVSDAATSTNPHVGMLLTFRAAVCRTLALCRGVKADSVIDHISERYAKVFPEHKSEFCANTITSQRSATAFLKILDKINDNKDIRF